MMRMEQCKAEPCIFRKMINNKVSLMVGAYVDDIIVSGEQDMCDKFFDQLRQRFPAKPSGNLRCILVAHSNVTGITESLR